VKEANAQKIRLENNTTTLAREYAREGLDYETQLEQRAKEKQMERDLKIVPAAAAAPVVDEDDEEDEGDQE